MKCCRGDRKVALLSRNQTLEKRASFRSSLHFSISSRKEREPRLFPSIRKSFNFNLQSKIWDLKFAANAALCLCLFLLPVFVVGQNTDEEVTVTTIQVWVKAEDRSGKPLEGLTINDFEIKEDGKKMTATCFEEFVLPPAPAGSSSTDTSTESALPAETDSTGKRLALFYDQLNTSQVEFLSIQPRLDTFLDELDGRKMGVMLAAYPPYEKLVPFTADIYVLRQELDRLSGNMFRDRDMLLRRKNIEFVLESKRQDSIAIALNMALAYQQEEIAEARLVLKALEDFGSYLSELQQREHTVVLLISGGINARPGRQYFDLVNTKTGETDDLPLGGIRSAGADILKELKRLLPGSIVTTSRFIRLIAVVRSIWSIRSPISILATFQRIVHTCTIIRMYWMRLRWKQAASLSRAP